MLFNDGKVREMDASFTKLKVGAQEGDYYKMAGAIMFKSSTF